jgi:hypothetical protein
MTTINPKIKEWFDNLETAAKVKYIKVTAMELQSAHVKMDKALDAELNAPARRGIRGGASTSATASAMNATDDYLRLKAELKYFIERL